MKICPVGAKLFHADGQRDIRTLIIAFCNFVNTPKTLEHEYVKMITNKHVSVEQHLRNTDLNIS